MRKPNDTASEPEEEQTNCSIKESRVFRGGFIFTKNVRETLRQYEDTVRLTTESSHLKGAEPDKT